MYRESILWKVGGSIEEEWMGGLGKFLKAVLLILLPFSLGIFDSKPFFWLAQSKAGFWHFGLVLLSSCSISWPFAEKKVTVIMNCRPRRGKKNERKESKYRSQSLHIFDANMPAKISARFHNSAKNLFANSVWHKPFFFYLFRFAAGSWL